MSIKAIKPIKPIKPKKLPITLLDIINDNNEHIIIHNKTKFGNREFLRIIELIKENKVEMLLLAGVKLNDADIVLLAGVLKTNTSLNYLDLSDNNITSCGINALLLVLQTNTFIKTLNISKNKFNYEVGQNLRNLIENNKTITELNISFSLICDSVAMPISQALEKNTTLTTFKCKDCKIGDIGIFYILKVLSNNNNTIMNFDVLQKSHINYELFRVLCCIWIKNKSMKTINTIDIQEYNMERDSINLLLYVLQNNHSITKLELSKNDKSDNNNNTILNLLANINLTNLKSIVIGVNTNFDDRCASFLYKVLSTNTTLLSITIDKLSLTPNGINCILSGLDRNKKLLDFRYSSLSILNPYESRINGFLARNKLLRDNEFWSPYIHIDFLKFDRYSQFDTNQKCNDVIITSLLCNTSRESKLLTLPIEIMFYIFSFFQRKMFYD